MEIENQKIKDKRMNLNQTILDAARDEVSREIGWPDWDSLMTNMEELQHTSNACHREAALLAMDRLAEFKDWQLEQADNPENDFDIVYENGIFFQIERDEEDQPIMHPNKLTELELYEIFTTQQ